MKINTFSLLTLIATCACVDMNDFVVEESSIGEIFYAQPGKVAGAKVGGTTVKAGDYVNYQFKDKSNKNWYISACANYDASSKNLAGFINDLTGYNTNSDIWAHGLWARFMSVTPPTATTMKGDKNALRSGDVKGHYDNSGRKFRAWISKSALKGKCNFL